GRDARARMGVDDWLRRRGRWCDRDAHHGGDQHAPRDAASSADANDRAPRARARRLSPGGDVLKRALLAVVLPLCACNAVDGADQYKKGDAPATCEQSCIDTSGTCLAKCTSTRDTCKS